MKVNILNPGDLPNPNFNKLIRVYLNEANKPTVYLCKFLHNDENNTAQVILRFNKNLDLQNKFYTKFKDEFTTLINAINSAKNLSQIKNLENYIFQIKKDVRLEDIYMDVDIGDEIPDALSDIDNPIAVNSSEKEIPKEIQSIIDELINITENDTNEEQVYEAYKRKGFRKDAKNPLVPIKIVRRDGVEATYYIRSNKVEEYSKNNRKLHDGRWKYYFYSNEIEQGMKRLDDLGLKDILDGFTKNGKYGTSATMAGLKTDAEKFLAELSNNRNAKITRNIIKNNNYIEESLSIGNLYKGKSRIEFSNKRIAQNGTNLIDVSITSEENTGNKIRNRNRISGTYTRKESRNRIFNSFHIDKVEGVLTKDQIAYLTTAHLKTHDMISVNVDGINDPRNLRLFLMAGYNWDKDTEANFETYKDRILQHLKDNLGENNPKLNKLKQLLDKSTTFRQFQLELYKTGNTDFINSVFRTGIFEKYGEMIGSKKLMFRSHTLAGTVSTNEKLLETFEVLRDRDNDYHLGHKISRKLDELILV